MELIKTAGPLLLIGICLIIIWKLNQKKKLMDDICPDSMAWGGLAGCLLAVFLNVTIHIGLDESLFACLGVIVGETAGMAIRRKEN